MRGLPGSGKSTLVKEIIKIYPNTVICSADHYFMENGQYIWSPERRYYAHQYSMKLATRCCEMNCPIVVIDNTNIMEIEAKAYFQIALKYSYVTILVSPQTPWRFDPIQLEKHGIHNVSLKTLRIKVNLFQDILPEFYAWVVGQQDAEVLKNLAVYHFQECLKYFPQLRTEILKILPEVQKDYCIENHFSNILKESLSCIAKNCLKGKVPGSLNFHAMDNVQSSCGKVFVLQVSRILVTPHFLLACVELNSQQKTLYGQSSLKSFKEMHKDVYKVVGKSKQVEQEKEDLVLASVGYTDEEMHQSCLEKIKVRLSLMLSKIKPGVGIETLQENHMTESHTRKSNKGKICTEDKNFEQTCTQEVMAAAVADDDGEDHSDAKAYEEAEVQPYTEKYISFSKEGELANILLTLNANPENCLEELKNILEMENAKDHKSFERISTDESDILCFNSMVYVVQLKKHVRVDAIFSGLY